MSRPFLTVPDELLEDVVRALDVGGVYAILDRDRDLLEALVIIGAVAPLMPTRFFLLNELRRNKFQNPEAILEKLIDITEKTGFLLVSADENQVLVHV